MKIESSVEKSLSSTLIVVFEATICLTEQSRFTNKTFFIINWPSVTLSPLSEGRPSYILWNLENKLWSILNFFKKWGKIIFKAKYVTSIYWEIPVSFYQWIKEFCRKSNLISIKNNPLDFAFTPKEVQVWNLENALVWTLFEM